jgi:hypothetical protein
MTQQSRLFGYSLERAKGGPQGTSFVQPYSDDAATPIVGGGHFGQYVDIDGYVKNEWELIMRYRDMSLHPECDSAIDDIVNEAINGGMDDVPVEVELSNLRVSDSLKKRIREEFHNILELLDFDRKSYDIFRRWYIDGRLFYHKVIDLQNPSAGLLELRFIDPRKIRKVIEYEEPKERAVAGSITDEAITRKSVEYYVYNQKGLRGYDTSGIKVAPDAICYAHSGLLDMNRNMVLSYMHKAIKALNQLRMIEDSLVIYRLSRAPERRIFYIDVGNLPKQKAEQYLREVMSRYRNKLVYDANTGEIKDDRKFMSMLEDFWLPRREGGRGTEITTLPGGQNLGELEDVKYFQRKLYRSLNVPESRLESESAFNIGRSAEINRDEIKFQKFITRLRKKFSDLFLDLLKTQCILKGVVTPEDWDQMKEHIQFSYVADNHFAELKDNEMLNERLGLVAQMDPYLGKYFSIDYIRRQILKQTETEIEEINEQMEQEIADGIIPDPAMMNDPMAMMGGMPGQPMGAPMGQPQQQLPPGPDQADYTRGQF